MKKIIMIIAIAIAATVAMYADDRPVDYNKVPAAAKTFINANFPGEKVTYSTKEDDLVRPDYHVRLDSGVLMTFDHAGRLEKIQTQNGVPAGVVPVQISDYVKLHYPDAVVVEYEVDKRSYEVRLSNRMELKFNSNWHLVEIDD